MSLGHWTGSLRLSPGAATGAVRLQRPDVADRLLPGCTAAAVPGRVAAVYTLCAQPQAHTARQALAAAAGEPVGHSPAIDHALAVATAREHLLRITQDWPPVFAQVTGISAGPGWQATALAGCPLWHPGLPDADRLTALGPWLAQHGLGMPPAEWLARHHDAPDAWAARWCQASSLPTACALRAVRARAQALATPAQSWAWPADAAAAAPTAQALAMAIAGGAGFALQPNWQGQPRDTGPWRRAAAGDGTHHAEASAWGRLVSRLVDLAALAGPPSPPRLLHGALATGALQGLAWTEMARGLLLHWVQLADSAAGLIVARYRVIAPTDWNCHPAGGLAQSVAALAPGDDGGARLLALAYDPCVPVHLHRQGEEAVHA